MILRKGAPSSRPALLQVLVQCINDVIVMQELDPLATLPRLESLSLLDNEVTKVKHYRSATAQPDAMCLVSRLLQLVHSHLPARPTLQAPE